MFTEFDKSRVSRDLDKKTFSCSNEERSWTLEHWGINRIWESRVPDTNYFQKFIFVSEHMNGEVADKNCGENWC